MNLSGIIMSIWVGYYVNRVKWWLFFFFVIVVNYDVSFKVIYYGFSNFFVGIWLDIDNFVVMFICGNKIVLELFLNFNNFCFCCINDVFFSSRDNYIVDINRCICDYCVVEIGIYDLVSSNYCVF